MGEATAAGGGVSTAIILAADVGGELAGRTADEQLVALWLHGMSRDTQRAYRRHSGEFFRFVAGKSLRAVTLAELQAFADHVQTLALAPGSRHRVLSAVKSLFAFGTRIGFLTFDVARPLRLPPLRDTLTERILEEDDVRRLLAGDSHPRNRLMLALLYVAGLRVSELVSLTWRDAQPHRGSGQLTVFGKGGKTRTVRLDAGTWAALQATRGTSPAEAPIFASRGGGHLDQSWVRRIVKAAAARAGVTTRVSPHWLRHCHASHALDRGAPIHLVQSSLGHASVATTSRYLHARPNHGSSEFLPPIN